MHFENCSAFGGSSTSGTLTSTDSNRSNKDVRNNGTLTSTDSNQSRSQLSQLDVFGFSQKVTPYHTHCTFTKPCYEKTGFLARLYKVQKSYCSHPGGTCSRHTLLKFSRSLYLDNQLSESIHTLTIGTL